MKVTSEKRALVALVLASCFCMACAVKPDTSMGSVSVVSGSFERLVSKDIVSVLRQVEALSPASTTVGIADNNGKQSAFAEAMTKEFQAAGYAIRSVSGGAGTIPLKLKVETGVNNLDTPEPDGTQTVTVSLGNVAVRRTYIAGSDGHVAPVGRMQVRGVDASRLHLDNKLFSMPAGQQYLDKPVATPKLEKPAEQLVQSAPALADSPVTTTGPTLAAIELNRGNILVQNRSTKTSRQSERPFLDLVAPSVAMARPQVVDALAMLSQKETENVKDLQQSNFENLFAEMGIVREKVLTFANDSTRMGSANKARVRELLQSFDPEQDILSVIGCSLGPTAHSGGQEGLARGRAMRVREELLYAGVPESQILAEGCWAAEAFDERMPRRGVVITLKRPVT